MYKYMNTIQFILGPNFTESMHVPTGFNVRVCVCARARACVPVCVLPHLEQDNSPPALALCLSQHRQLLTSLPLALAFSAQKTLPLSSQGLGIESLLKRRKKSFEEEEEKL
jgi:hypothetical protein